MADQIPAETSDERLQRLQALLAVHSHRFNRETVGRRTEVLIERDGRHPGQRLGKSPWLQSVVVETPATIGALVAVEITSAGPNSVGGSPLATMAAA